MPVGALDKKRKYRNSVIYKNNFKERLEIKNVFKTLHLEFGDNLIENILLIQNKFQFFNQIFTFLVYKITEVIILNKILLVEDDKKISRYLELELSHEGYTVKSCYNGRDALKEIKNDLFDLVILDLMLPEVSGEEVCKKIREASEIPIIVVSAKDSTLNKVNLLDIGADDYITKPFIIEELLARIRVALRNKKQFSTKDLLRYRDLILDKSTCRVSRQQSNIKLSKTEFKLIEYFMINSEIVLNREQILNNIWGYDYLGGEKIVDVYIKALRKKIDDPFQENLIKTVRGFGYILKGE